MLCIPTSKAERSGNLLIAGDSITSSDAFIKDNSMITLFSGSKASMFRVDGTETSGKSQRFKLAKEREISLNPEIINFIAANPGADLSLEELEKLAIYSKASSLPEIVLNIKQKPGFYARFILTDPVKNCFIESYIKWNEWEIIEKEFLSIREEINSGIKNRLTGELNEKKGLYRRVFERVWEILKINFNEIMINRDYARMTVQWPGRSMFIPFESISDRLLIRYSIPGPQRLSCGSPPYFTLIYSDESPHSRKETFDISNIINSRYQVEYFSDNNYKNYRSSLSGSSFFHFTGHGALNADRKGELIIDGERMEEIIYLKNADFAFLNCCSCGAYPEGIIASLINNGMANVIASPYEITPEENSHAELQAAGFYRWFYPQDIRLFFDIYRLLYPGASLYLRLFTRFNNKI